MSGSVSHERGINPLVIFRIWRMNTVGNTEPESTWPIPMEITSCAGSQSMITWLISLNFLGMPISDDDLHSCRMQSLLNAKVRLSFRCCQLLGHANSLGLFFLLRSHLPPLSSRPLTPSPASGWVHSWHLHTTVISLFQRQNPSRPLLQTIRFFFFLHNYVTNKYLLFLAALKKAE